MSACETLGGFFAQILRDIEVKSRNTLLLVKNFQRQKEYILSSEIAPTRLVIFQELK